jgi:type IV secretion system protein VirB4
LIDEGFVVLDDDYFAKVLVENNARTNRKKNNFIIISTQQPEDTANSRISKALNEVASFKIFYPNPTANQIIYCNNLGLTTHELEIVRNLDSNSRYFLLQFARGREVEIARMNLKNMNTALQLISGREQSVKLLHTILADIPNSTPKEWVSIFLARCKDVVDG